jgi:L-ascorbate metabolism protein UlaG (beta-lactamase superfamily)
MKPEKICLWKNKRLVFVLLFQTIITLVSNGQEKFTTHSVGHGTLYFEYKNLVIHVDPVMAQANYDTMPKADIILITHGHGDHYDVQALNKIKTNSTIMVFTQEVKNLGTYSGTFFVLKNGDSMLVKGILIKAVAAYNLVNTSYHPKGVGNGYILTFGEKRIYIAGDTENIPEMDNLDRIDIAFLPMNLPYTMTPNAAAEAAKRIKPDILYIYHFGNSDTALLRQLLIDQKMVVRIGKSVFVESDKRLPVSSKFYNILNDSKLSCFPNPVMDRLTIQNPVQESLLKVFDGSGHLLMQQCLSLLGNQTIDLNSCKSGMIILKVSSKEKDYSTLILKQ